MMIGAPKCATTSLASMLAHHPDVTFSYPKEPRFFEYEYPYGREWYLNKYYGGMPHRKTFGEGRVLNMSIGYVPPRVLGMFGKDVKIIMCVREPARRFLSEWANWHDMRAGREPLGVREAFKANKMEFDLQYYDNERAWVTDMDIKGGPYRRSYLENGMYAHWIAYWGKWFDNIHVVCYEDLVADTDKEYAKITDFLEIDRVNAQDLPQKKIGISHNHHLDLVLQLRNYYAYSVNQLSILTGVDYTSKWGY